jgi:hypothetical protein
MYTLVIINYEGWNWILEKIIRVKMKEKMINNKL